MENLNLDVEIRINAFQKNGDAINMKIVQMQLMNKIAIMPMKVHQPHKLLKMLEPIHMQDN